MREQTLNIIQIDTREQAPLPIRRFLVERAGLPVGDYGVKGFSDWSNPRFIVERKSLDDLAGSLGNGRERFLREIEKLRQFGFRALVIEGQRADVEAHAYRSSIAPASILGTLDALAVRAGLHVFWCGDAEGAARQVESLAEKFVRGIEKDYKLALATTSAEEGDNHHGRETAA